MSELNPKRFETGTNAQQRSAEEQRRLMEESDQARYEEAFPVDADAEKTYDEAMAAREAEAANRERDENALVEGRVMEHPETRFMYMMAQEIAKLRANGGIPEIIEDKENRLQELLEKYTEKAHADRDLAFKNAEINERSTIKGGQDRLKQEAEAQRELDERLQEADFIINSTDEAWVQEKLGTAEKGTTEPVDDDKEDLVQDVEENRILLDKVEDIRRLLQENPELAKNPDFLEELRKTREAIDAALAAAKEASYVDKDTALNEAYDEYAEREGSPYDVDKGRVQDEEEARDLALEENAERNGNRVEDINEAWDQAHAEDKSLAGPQPRHGFRGLMDRVGLALALRGGSPSGVVARIPERLRSSDRHTTIALIAGGIAVIGVALLGRHQGWWLDGGDHAGSGSSGDFGVDQVGGDHGSGSADASDIDTDSAGDGNGVNASGQSINGTSVEAAVATMPTGPEIPGGDGFAYPWDWATAAIENHSINPNGMSAEELLKSLGEKARDAGHVVEWYSVGDGREAVRIDGSDDTAKVVDVLRQFAK